jgi:hypothetical protein
MQCILTSSSACTHIGLGTNGLYCVADVFICSFLGHRKNLAFFLRSAPNIYCKIKFAEHGSSSLQEEEAGQGEDKKRVLMI